MNKNTKIAFGVMLLIIIALALVIVFRPSSEVPVFDEKPYRDSISLLVKERDGFHKQYDSLDTEYKTLELSKQQIKIIYREKYKFIKGATVPELDSIIRYHW